MPLSYKPLRMKKGVLAPYKNLRVMIIRVYCLALPPTMCIAKEAVFAVVAVRAIILVAIV